ncbi:MFS transporter [Sulfurospirillum deleyianum]|uniref:Major facilitator superfamily MFS_1 n=1 Tax=Sulfurospirillum deleyianum (strain ATCC 51133 / DSM 6946 / 5175) TaxID=525898 RepID=D1B263_SULD5|nr:MFS transporter [Sulfurospirillum deleyianum]ACZ12183.1 major facilitator superfamily MFS_1 [Sulfurospirillum deleyianum DSM 6946]
MKHTRTHVHKNDATPLWSAVWAMSLCAMVLVASEFMPVSLLTPIATDLHMSEGFTGQSIAISGLFALITSLWLTSWIGHANRRKVLLFFTFLMGISGIVVSFAPNATVLMVGRALLGACIGGFWSMSAAVVMRLVPEKAIPKALALLNGGNALSTTIAAPLGSFLGGIIGWRGAFFTIVPLAAIAFIWQWRSLPSLPATRREDGKKTSVRHVLKLLKRTDVSLGMLGAMFLFMGQFALFTYLRPFLESVLGINVEVLSFILLAMGLCGLLGTFAIGHALKTLLYSLLIGTPFLMMVIALALTYMGSSFFWVVVLLSLWGFLGTSIPVAWWTWLAQTLPHEAEVGGGLMVAIVQLAITLGASIGGIFFDAFGYQSTFLFASLCFASSVFVALIIAFQHSLHVKS